MLLWGPVGLPVNEDESNAGRVEVAHDGAGGVLIAWEVQLQPGTSDIRAQRVDLNGNLVWLTELAVTDTVGIKYVTAVDEDGFGNMLLSWEDHRDLINPDIYASKITPDRQLPWGRNGRLVFSAARSQQYPSLCRDGSGGCYVACVTEVENAADHDLLIQRIDSDGNLMWQPGGIVLCNAPEDQRDVRVALSNNGGTPDGCLTIWYDQRVNGLSREVYAQKVLPTGSMAWPPNGVLVCGDANPDGSGHDRYGGRLTTDNAGGLICAWEDTRTDGNQQNSDLYAARVLASGTFAWGGACGVPVAVATSMQLDPVVSMGSGDGLFVLWEDFRRGSPGLRYQELSLATGNRQLDSAGVEIFYGLAGNARRPLVVALNDGHVAFVWADNRMLGRGRMIYYQITDTLGHELMGSNGAPLAPDNSGHDIYAQDNHQIAPDGNGGFFVTFEDVRAAFRQIRLQHINPTGQRMCTDAARVVYDDMYSPDQQWSYCAPDDAGGCYVAWSNYDPDYHIDVFIHRTNSNCEPVWAEPIQLSTAHEDDVMYGITSNPDGCCIALWISGGLGNYNVSAARVCPDGTVYWNRDVCDATDNQFNPSVIADGQGGAYFAWADQREPSLGRDIYAQHITAAGTESWPHNGMVVASAPDHQNHPVLALDASQNLYVAWEHFVGYNIRDLYAQRISPAGERRWPVEGLPLCTMEGDQELGGIQVDARNGFLAVWHDSRSGTSHIYATHIDSTGQPTGDPFYQPGGTLFSDSLALQNDPVITTDNVGGYVAAWHRITGDWEYNVYAQRLREGPLPAKEHPSVTPTAFVLYPNAPNPFNATTEIVFELPRASHVQLEVFDLLGQHVATIANGRRVAGRHRVRFDGSELPSGIYFYRLQAADFSASRKMVLLK